MAKKNKIKVVDDMDLRCVSIKLPIRVHRQIAALAEEKGLPSSTFMRMIIIKYMNLTMV